MYLANRTQATCLKKNVCSKTNIRKKKPKLKPKFLIKSSDI